MNKESCFTVFLFSSIQVFPAPIVWLLYLLQCWFSPRTPKGKYGCYYGLNTGRRHETIPLLFPRTLIHWKQLCRMGRQWVIPTSCWAPNHNTQASLQRRNSTSLFAPYYLWFLESIILNNIRIISYRICMSDKMSTKMRFLVKLFSTFISHEHHCY